MLREATLKDVKPLLGFLKPFHEEGGYKDIAPQNKVGSYQLTGHAFLPHA